MKNIAVVFGGYSSEYEVSVKSGKFIYDNLKDNSDWNVYEVCISKNKKTVKFKERIFNLDYKNFSFNIDNEIIKEILCSLDAPLVSTSLHHIEDEIRVYYSDPTEIYEHFSDKIDVIVLGGTGRLTHSTIVDCTQGDANITRQGLGILSE